MVRGRVFIVMAIATAVCMLFTGVAAGLDSKLTIPLTGKVVAPSGAPVRDATVSLSALPNEAVSPTRGDIPITTTTTDEQGRFVLTVPRFRADLLELAKFNNGALNMQILVTGVAPSDADASAAQREGLAGMDKIVGVGGGGAGTAVSAAMAVSTVALGAPEVGRGLALSSTNVGTLTAVKFTKNVNHMANEPPEGVCRGNGSQTLGEEFPYVALGEFHAYEDVKGWWRYGRTADSDLGVGYNHDGQGWKAGGTVHMGNSQSASVGVNRGPYWGKKLVSKFHYVKERHFFVCDRGGYYIDRIRALAWIGGILEGQDVSHLDGWNHYYHVRYETSCGEACVNAFAPGSDFHRSTGRGAKYGVAVTAFGIGLSAQSGYSVSLQMHWDFGPQNFTHYLFCHCGAPPNSANVYSW